MYYLIAVTVWYCLMVWARKKYFSEPEPIEPERVLLHECVECKNLQVYNNQYCSKCGSEELAVTGDNYYINTN